MRLIDADALIGAIRHDADQATDSNWGYGLNHAVVIVRNQPTVDAISVVRCKDCKWGDWSRNGKDEEMILCYNGDTGIEDGYLHEPDWFCAEGERRTEDA